jgi:hypothetical protein
VRILSVVEESRRHRGGTRHGKGQQETGGRAR